MNEIEVWTSDGKKSTPLEQCLSVTAKDSDFFVVCQDDLSGAISLDSYNKILENNPEIIDRKGLELGEMREKLKVLFGND